MTLTADPNTIVQVDPSTLTFNEALFQKMPQLNDESRELLLADITAKGVTVPVEITAEGVVVDGHNRVRLAVEAGIDTIPAIVKHFDSDEDATAHVFAVNLQRRHLNQTDKRKLVKEFLALDPYKSNRQVAEELGGAVTDKTVADVRDHAEAAGELPAATSRKGKDGKTRSASTSKPKASKGAGERRKIELERNATSSIRMGLDEAARLLAKNTDLNVATMLGIMTTKQKAKLTESLVSILPVILGIASELGIEVEDLPAPATEVEAAPAGVDESTVEDSGDAPF